VINTGVPGYSTFQSAGQLRRFGEQLAPDMVLLGFCLNDVTERYTKLAAYGGSRIFMLNVDTARGLAWPNRVWLASAIRQAFVGLIRGAASRGQDYRLRALWEEPDSSPIAEAWKTVFREIDDIRAEATRLGVPLGILIYPLAVQVEISSGYEAPQQVLATHLAGQGIPYLDLLAPLRDSPLPMRQLFLDITHFSPSGTVEVARIAASFVYETYLAER
jgi:lysophospholipase L1-like esterase